MYIFLVAIILVALILVLLPFWVNLITQSEKEDDYWEPKLSMQARVAVSLLALSLFSMAGIYTGKSGVENWFFTFFMFLYSLYLMDCYLAGRVMVLPRGRIESGRYHYLRRVVFVFSLALVIVWSLV